MKRYIPVIFLIVVCAGYSLSPIVFGEAYGQIMKIYTELNHEVRKFSYTAAG
jgi:hypothetical protein